MKGIIKKTFMGLAAAALIVGYAYDADAGRYHVTGPESSTGVPGGINTLICYDCHTMHASNEQGFGGSGSTDPYNDGRGIWLDPSANPSKYLLKGGGTGMTEVVNNTCLGCHDGESFAPDVLGANTNAGSYNKGRAAGALNDSSTTGEGYEAYMGHTLGDMTPPPGYDPAALGGDWYNDKYLNDSRGLECIGCHYQHGRKGKYRNISGPKSQYEDAGAGGSRSFWQAKEYVNTSAYSPGDDIDVWVMVDETYVGGQGTGPDFNYYSFGKRRFNWNEANAQDTVFPQSSNRVANMCATCHYNFHGSEGTEDGTSVGSKAFLRHPTGGVSITDQTGGRWSSLSYFSNTDLPDGTGLYDDTATSVAKVDAAATWTDWNTFDDTAEAGPFCLTCHKAHGNKNPFGLFFLNPADDDVSEEGSALTAGKPDKNFRNLCGQCHNTTSG